MEHHDGTATLFLIEHFEKVICMNLVLWGNLLL